jgi:hypothetical protein
MSGPLDLSSAPLAIGDQRSDPATDPRGRGLGARRRSAIWWLPRARGPRLHPLAIRRRAGNGDGARRPRKRRESGRGKAAGRFGRSVPTLREHVHASCVRIGQAWRTCVALHGSEGCWNDRAVLGSRSGVFSIRTGRASPHRTIPRRTGGRVDAKSPPAWLAEASAAPVTANFAVLSSLKRGSGPGTSNSPDVLCDLGTARGSPSQSEVPGEVRDSLE